MHDELINEFIRSRFTPNPNRYLDPAFPRQNDFVLDDSRFIAAQCSRRAGKSNGLAIRFIRTLETHPNCFCPYISLTRESAKNIMWPALQEQSEKLGVPLEFTESNLTVKHGNGARLQLFGADTKNFIRRLKGIKTPGAGVDEAQDFGGHLQSLVDDVLTPTLTDYEDSWLALTGTPGPIPKGYFYEVTAQGKYGFSKHSWTLLDNPYLPNAKRFIEDLKQKKGWDDTNPTLRREWYNEWVLDLESLLIRWSKEKNDFQELPLEHAWQYILGIDVGFGDADALAVIAWSNTSPNIYLAEEVVVSGQDVSALAESIRALYSRYQFHKMVIDTGGLGKKIAEELTRRFGLPLVAADKARKMENVALLNDFLSRSRFKAKADSRFVADSYRVQLDWDKSTPDRLVVKNDFHSDIIDAALYAFRESPAWTYEEPKPKPAYGTKAWQEAEREAMEQAAMEHFQNQMESFDRF